MSSWGHDMSVHMVVARNRKMADVGVSENQWPYSRPQMVSLLLFGHHGNKIPRYFRNSHVRSIFPKKLWGLSATRASKRLSWRPVLAIYPPAPNKAQIRFD